MKSKSYLLVPVFLLMLAGAGCATPSTTPHTATDSHADHMMEIGGHSMNEAATLAGNRIELEQENALRTGAVRLSFKLRAANGKELGVNDLKIVHDKRVHLLIVRDDMTQFQHLHPEYVNEKWTVTTVIPEQGDYQMYIDIAPEKEAPVVLRKPLRIGGATLTRTFPVPNAEASASDQGVKALLHVDGALQTGEAKILTFSLVKDGKPAASIAPYLGAYGHVVLLRHHEPSDFLHVHPITEVTPIDGKVAFGTTFEKQGRYTLYAQFHAEGSVKTFPITIDIEEGGTTNQVQEIDHHTHH